MGDHSETVQIDYDPTRISYEELLDIFWASHNPKRPASSRQYASIILYHDEEQRRLAEESKQRYESQCGCRVYTEIVPLEKFYWAEAYHQKYYLQGSRLFMDEFTTIYPDATDFVNSTAAARVNGYLGGHGTLDQLQTELEQLGLSPRAQEQLLDIVRRRGR